MNITYAYIETTTYCNLACKYCNRENTAIHMPVFNFERVLDQLRGHPIKEAKLMGMGEPFMHPDFGQLCNDFKNSFPECNLITATNCQLKFNDNFRAALEAVDMCYLSVDGYGQTFEELREGASWDKLLRFLHDISEYQIKHNVSVQLPINFTISPQNVDDIPLIIDLTKQFGLDDIRLNLVQNWNEDQFDVELANFTGEQFHTIAQYKQFLKGKTPWDFRDCFWVNSGCMIAANGDVRVCCMNTSTKPIGNLFDTPLEKLYESDRYSKIRVGCHTNTPSEHCRTCSYKELSPILARIHGIQ